MPYIEEDRRKPLNELEATPQTAGELNYVITMSLIGYLHEHGLSYATINDIVGALEGAKQEFYRRIAEPYENLKVMRNGDVYPTVSSLLPQEDTDGGG